MTSYILEKDGDLWEREWGSYLKNSFSNYQLFWQKFIADSLTNRPKNIGIRKGLAACLEEMIMAHYSVFLHLGKTHWLIEEHDSSKKQRNLSKKINPEMYSEAFFHLGTATEMVERLIFVIWKIAVETGKLHKIEPYGDDENLLNDLKKYIADNKYEKEFNRYQDTGQSVSFKIHNIRDVYEELGNLCKNKVEWDNICKNFFKKLIDQKIRPYRNFLAHNPILGSFTEDGTVFLPKHDKLREYRLWSTIFYQKDFNKDHFVAIDNILSLLLTEFESCANDLWLHLIELMDIFNNSSEYQRLIGTGNVLLRGHSPTIPTVSSGEATGYYSSSSSSKSILSRPNTHSNEDNPEE